jgi:CRP-like cAMP-binding protein
MRGVSPAQISRFEPFTGLNSALLFALCRHARMVDVPAGRWLLRPGRLLRGTHYLFQGSLETVAPNRVVHAGDADARQSVYPGAAGLKTLSDCRLLRLAEEGMSLLDTQDRAALPTVSREDDCWQTRFLRSHLMTVLPKSLWQQVLSNMVPIVAEAGEMIIVEGSVEDRDACYVIGSSGRAVVTVGGRRVHELGAGDLFGEDALISAQPRNASVEMVEPGAVMRLEAGPFRDFLAEVLAVGAFEEPAGANFSNAPRQIFEVSSVKGLRERIARLDVSVTYLVSSADARLLALALFLLKKRGLRAWPRS